TSAGPGGGALDAWRALDAIVLIRLDLLDVVILAGDDAGLARGVVRHGQEEQLVHVGDALPGETVGGLAARRVAVEARELDVAIGSVLDELERSGADVVLQLALARPLAH